jgi:hypothetical protein
MNHGKPTSEHCEVCGDEYLDASGEGICPACKQDLHVRAQSRRILDATGSGWKTIAGATILAIVGIGNMAAYILLPEQRANLFAPTEALAIVAAALSLLGIGHKAERVEGRMNILTKFANGRRKANGDSS